MNEMQSGAEDSVDFKKLPESVYQTLVPYDIAQWAPPANLPPTVAFENYIRRSQANGTRLLSETAFLGNFVARTDHLVDLELVLNRYCDLTIPISILCPDNMAYAGGVQQQIDLIDDFYSVYGTYGNRGQTRMGFPAKINAFELPTLPPKDVHYFYGALTERVLNEQMEDDRSRSRHDINPAPRVLKVPKVFVEIAPYEVDDTRFARQINFKIRLGGKLRPEPASVAHFMTVCADEGRQYKATAGLHDPFSHDGAYGYVNVNFASYAAGKGYLERDIAEILTIENPEEFNFFKRGISCGIFAAQSSDIGPMRGEDERRRGVLLSIGTCDFDAPMKGLKHLSIKE